MGPSTTKGEHVTRGTRPAGPGLLGIGRRRFLLDQHGPHLSGRVPSLPLPRAVIHLEIAGMRRMLGAKRIGEQRQL